VRARAVAFGLLLALAGQPVRKAVACGFCPGDKIASVYDGAVVVEAFRQGQGVAYLDIAGAFPASTEAGQLVERALDRTKGVRKGSVVVSLAPLAVRIVFDPRRTNLPDLIAAANRRLRKQHWSLVVMKVDCAEAAKHSAPSVQPRPRRQQLPHPRHQPAPPQP
jgi:hypothetical protein